LCLRFKSILSPNDCFLLYRFFRLTILGKCMFRLTNVRISIEWLT